MRVTLGLVAANAAVFAVMATADGGAELDFSVEKLIAYGGLTATGLEAGESWRLVTSIFLHASLTHLAWNMTGLAFLGWTLEARIGPAVYAFVYLCSGLVGSVATAAALPQGSDVVAIGASGAVSGLIGAGAIAALRLGPRARALRNGLAGWAALVIVNGFAYEANNVAHASGLLAGALLAPLLVRDLARFASSAGGFAQLLGTDRPLCPACGTGNPAAATFCGTCGMRLAPAPLGPQDVGPDHAVVPALLAAVQGDRDHPEEEHRDAQGEAQIP